MERNKSQNWIRQLCGIFNVSARNSAKSPWRFFLQALHNMGSRSKKNLAMTTDSATETRIYREQAIDELDIGKTTFYKWVN